jgi:hypothetical protein
MHNLQPNRLARTCDTCENLFFRLSSQFALHPLPLPDVIKTVHHIVKKRIGNELIELCIVLFVVIQ